MEKAYLLLLAVCMTLLFFVAGIKHALTFKPSTQFLEKFFPFSRFPRNLNMLIEFVAIVIEICAPLLLLLALANDKFRHIGRIAAYALAFFLLCTLIFIHNPTFKGEGMNFLKGLALLGGVLLLERQLIL